MTRTIAGVAAAAALTLGAAACSSDETDPGGDDPIEDSVLDTLPVDSVVESLPVDSVVEE